MLGIEQQAVGDVVLLAHVHPGDVAEFVVVGGGADRAVAGLQYFERNFSRSRQNRALPTARAERGDGGQHDRFGTQGQYRAVGGKVVGGGAGGGGQQHAVCDQALDALTAVDQNADVRGLIGLPEQGDLVDGHRLSRLPALVGGRHLQRVEHHLARGGNAFEQVVLGEAV